MVSFNNQKLIVKLLFLFTYAGIAAWLSYFYVYLKEIPMLTSFEVGIIAGFQQFNVILIVPIWGIWADKFGRKNTLLVSIGVTLLLLPCFIFFKGVLAIILFMIVVTLFYSPIVALLDTLALDFEEQSQGKITFGELRLWASIGWAVSSFLSGQIINHERLQYIFPIASLLLLLSWLLLKLTYKPLTVTRNLKSVSLKGVLTLLQSEKKLVLFLLFVIFYSFLSAPVYLIINVYYMNLGGDNSIIGLAFAVQALSELPFFLYGKRLVERFGATNVLLFAMFATALRMIAYGFNHSPYAAVGIGVIHGISIGLFFVSMVAFVHRIVPAGLRSSGQSLIVICYAGGVAFGNLLTGFLDEIISINKTMLLNGLLIILLVLLAFFIKTKYPSLVYKKP